MTSHASETRQGARFEFGKNWQKFVVKLNNDQIKSAEIGLTTPLKMQDLSGKSFLDIGSGSGLSSLVAYKLGAVVHSFDYDPASVACTRELKHNAAACDDWIVDEGSVLDQAYMKSLGKFDIVYSWGVLHHTGAMWTALDAAGKCVAPNGLLFVAIYNDQGGPSRRWLSVKNIYNRLPNFLRFIVLYPSVLRLWGPTIIKFLVTARFSELRRKFTKSPRGMSPWRDMIDWVGGLPFEVAKPEEIFEFFQSRGFVLTYLRTCAGGIGCNEFVFKKLS